MRTLALLVLFVVLSWSQIGFSQIKFQLVPGYRMTQPSLTNPGGGLRLVPNSPQVFVPQVYPFPHIPLYAQQYYVPIYLPFQQNYYLQATQYQWAAPAAPPTAPVRPAITTPPQQTPVSKDFARIRIVAPSGSVVVWNEREYTVGNDPLLLDSPALRSGQSYYFELVIKWESDGKKLEDRKNIQALAGDEKSLIYR
ncbi:MAG: hypothetical protein R3B84_09180 [Zavarzinella sp.]